MKMNHRNRNNINNNILLNYFKRHNYSDYSINNLNEESKNNNNNSTMESRYLQFLNEQKQGSLNPKYKININEDNTKLINTKKIFKFKRDQVYSKNNTFYNEATKDKIINLKNNINANSKRNFHNLKILNKNETINATVNENEQLNKIKKYKLIFHNKNKTKDDKNYLDYKKEIYENASKQLHEKVEMVKDINIKIKKMKSLSKKYLIKKPIIIKALPREENDNNKENINIGNININNITIEHDIVIIDNNNNKENSTILNEDFNAFNKIIIDKPKHNKTISYKFNKPKPEFDTDYEYNYFDISKLKSNPQIPKEYSNIIYHNLLLEEHKGIIPNPDYEKIIAQKEINEHMRSILIDWLIDVHYKFGFKDETLYMTILIIDRYISFKPIEKKRFQLLGITALLISCKHEEIILPKIDDIIYITDKAYVKQDVIDMENDILDSFNFDLLFPSPIKFYEYLALKFDFDKKKFLMGKYLMESFMIDINWVKYRASVIACSCIYIVTKYYKMDNYKEAYDKKYYNLNVNDKNNDKYKTDSDIKDCAKDICTFIDNVNKTNYLSCKAKYSSEENEKVSLIISGEIE